MQQRANHFEDDGIDELPEQIQPRQQRNRSLGEAFINDMSELNPNPPG